MFNKFKIVKHWHSSDANDFLYRVLRREYLFFWSYQSAHSTIEHAKHSIASAIETEERRKRKIRNTPADEVIYKQ